MLRFSNNKITPAIQRFIDIIENNKKEQLSKSYMERDICPPCTDAQLVVECLCDVFLGEDWYTVFPLHSTQVNTCILDEILYKYCKEYRKYYKTTNKRYKYRK